MKRLSAVLALLSFLVLPAAFAEGEVLATEVITLKAVAKAKEAGYPLTNIRVVHDKGNMLFEEHMKQTGGETLALKGKDYQAVYFQPKDTAIKDGDMWVVVDRHSGEVLYHSKGK